MENYVQVSAKDYEPKRLSEQSKKWANDKRLALEFLRRQEELALWIESMLDRKLLSHDLHLELRSGVVLCDLVRIEQDAFKLTR